MQKAWCYSSFLIFSHNPYLVHQQILLALLLKYIQNIITSPHLFCHYSGSSPNYFFLILPKELPGWSLPIPTSVTPSVTPLLQTKGFLLIRDKATALHTHTGPILSAIGCLYALISCHFPHQSLHPNWPLLYFSNKPAGSCLWGSLYSSSSFCLECSSLGESCVYKSLLKSHPLNEPFPGLLI